MPILIAQVQKRKRELMAELKARRIPYEERIAKLDEVTWPQPEAEFIHETFDLFAKTHPWLREESIHPKSVAREMVEDYLGFTDYVRRYGLQRSEGVLLRYLSQVYKTLDQNVPDQAKTEEVLDIVGFFRALLERVDTSLIEEWESLLHPELRLEGITDSKVAHRILAAQELRTNPKALTTRLRAELHLLVAALAGKDWEEAAASVRPDPTDPAVLDTPEDFEEAMGPFFEIFDYLVFDHRARLAENTQITPAGEVAWDVVQVLIDPDEDNLWCIEGRIDLGDEAQVAGPLVKVTRIGT